MLALGGSVGYHGTHDLITRVRTVVQEAFGSGILVDLSGELSSDGTALGMVREVFASSPEANPLDEPRG